MKEKLQQLMKSEGLTSSRMAEMLGVQPSGISHILSGRNKPGFDLLQKILKRFPQVNPDWLLLDAEQMYRSAEEAVPAEKREIPSSPGLPFVEKEKRGASEELPPVVGLSAALEAGASAGDSRSNPVVRVVLVYADRTFEVLSLREP